MGSSGMPMRQGRILYFCKVYSGSLGSARVNTKPAIIDIINSPPSRQHICEDNAHVDANADTTYPETQEISNHVYLLLKVVISPEAYPRQVEWPFDGI